MKFIKWPGSKRTAAKHVGPIVAQQLKGRSNLVVPFAGSLALVEWLYVHGHLDGVKVWANDYNPWLINAWKVVQDIECHQPLIDWLEKQSKTWEALPPVRKDVMFEGIRTSLRGPPDASHPVVSAGMFLFFNRTCFNGLWRESKKSGLNVPIGKRSNGDYMKLPNWNEVLRAGSWVREADIQFDIGDFRAHLDNLDGRGILWDDTVIYADPPYYKKFVGYNKNGFSEDDQTDLVVQMETYNVEGCRGVLSNSAEFGEHLGRRWDISYFKSSMSVSCSKEKGKLPEMIGVLR